VTIHDQFVIIATYFIPAHEGSRTSLPQKDVLKLWQRYCPRARAANRGCMSALHGSPAHSTRLYLASHAYGLFSVLIVPGMAQRDVDMVVRTIMVVDAAITILGAT
jgi:hypothetical protein